MQFQLNNDKSLLNLSQIIEEQTSYIDQTFINNSIIEKLDASIANVQHNINQLQNILTLDRQDDR